MSMQQTFLSKLFNRFCLAVGWDSSDEIMKSFFIAVYLETGDFDKTAEELSSWLAQYYYIYYSNDQIPDNHVDSLLEFSLLGMTEIIR